MENEQKLIDEVKKELTRRYRALKKKWHEISKNNKYAPEQFKKRFGVYSEPSINLKKKVNHTEIKKKFYVHKPKIIDGNGSWRWCDWEMDKGKRNIIITIPDKFFVDDFSIFKSLKYPLTINNYINKERLEWHIKDKIIDELDTNK